MSLHNDTNTFTQTIIHTPLFLKDSVHSMMTKP